MGDQCETYGFWVSQWLIQAIRCDIGRLLLRSDRGIQPTVASDASICHYPCQLECIHTWVLQNRWAGKTKGWLQRTRDISLVGNCGSLFVFFEPLWFAIDCGVIYRLHMRLHNTRQSGCHDDVPRRSIVSISRATGSIKSPRCFDVKYDNLHNVLTPRGLRTWLLALRFIQVWDPRKNPNRSRSGA